MDIDTRKKNDFKKGLKDQTNPDWNTRNTQRMMLRKKKYILG